MHRPVLHPGCQGEAEGIKEFQEVVVFRLTVVAQGPAHGGALPLTNLCKDKPRGPSGLQGPGLILYQFLLTRPGVHGGWYALQCVHDSRYSKSVLSAGYQIYW